MKLTVIELFAGVGGFRIGLEGFNGKSASSNYSKDIDSNYEVVWSNQFEPLTKRQHASEVYTNNWPNSKHNSNNIEDVIKTDFGSIPQHKLLVGGFPCQDYSVATTLKNSKGLIGKKGVLWWSIYNILEKQGKMSADYILLENVDRLLVSPAKQRGRDFAVMLSCLNKLGFAVEWRIINAADYGMPQRRRRVYILGYKKGTKVYNKIKKSKVEDYMQNNGVFAEAFPVKKKEYTITKGKVEKNIQLVSDNFNLKKSNSPFHNTGIMIDGKFYSAKTEPVKSKLSPLDKILVPIEKVDNSFIIDKTKKLKKEIIKCQIDGRELVLKTEYDMWKYLKGSKKELRENKASNFTYKYAEGKMIFPDETNKPSRTIITGEGGSSPSRFKHVIKQGDTERRLTPVELERLNMFPDDHTKLEGVTYAKRAFFMGNALVVGVIEKIGKKLYDHIK
jgi:DNA (cytosine-5)-methyltransferase 1